MYLKLMVKLPLLFLAFYAGHIYGSTRLPEYTPDELDCPPRYAQQLTRYKGLTWGSDNRAIYTIPPEVRLVVSSIPKANMGIVATTFIPAWTWLAAYEGEVVHKGGHLSPYAWQVHRGDVVSHYIDAVTLDRSNWLRWVNCPRHIKEENVRMMACKGVVYYITSKDIRPGEELLVYYGKGYFENMLHGNATQFYDPNFTVARCKGKKVCCKDQVVPVVPP